METIATVTLLVVGAAVLNRIAQHRRQDEYERLVAWRLARYAGPLAQLPNTK